MARREGWLIAVLIGLLLVSVALPGAANGDEGTKKVSLKIAALPLVSIEPECVDPVWPVPDGAATVELQDPTLLAAGEPVSGTVFVDDLSWLQGDIVSQAGDFLLYIQPTVPGAVVFADGKGYHEHVVDVYDIQEDGSYTYDFDILYGYGGEEEIALVLGWKIRILTEGACSIAINAAVLGAIIHQSDPSLFVRTVCECLKNLPAPGSWACKIHPRTFRAAWSLWGCQNLGYGPSPF